MSKPKLHGIPLWEVEIKGLNVVLWITGPLRSVVSKATKICWQDHGIRKPVFDTIKNHGTLDA